MSNNLTALICMTIINGCEKALQIKDAALATFSIAKRCQCKIIGEARVFVIY